MPKQVDFPRASLERSLELAEAVNDCAGNNNCAVDTVADKLGKKVSGAFHALITAGVRFELIHNNRGALSITELYKSYSLSYDKTEELSYLKMIFLKPPLFERLHHRFSGKELPINHLDKMLIREFDVPEAMASRVSKYFIDGARLCALIDENNMVLPTDEANESNSVNEEANIFSTPDKSVLDNIGDFSATRKEVISKEIDKYFITFQGPGMNSTINIEDNIDFQIIEAMLNKIKNKLEES